MKVITMEKEQNKKQKAKEWSYERAMQNLSEGFYNPPQEQETEEEIKERKRLQEISLEDLKLLREELKKERQRKGKNFLSDKRLY